jgi:hypothetical protein
MSLRCSCAVRSDSLYIKGRGEPWDLESHESATGTANTYSGRRFWEVGNNRLLMQDSLTSRLVTEAPASWTVASAGWTPGSATFNYRKSRNMRRCSFAACIQMAGDTTFAGVLRLQLPHQASQEQPRWTGGGWFYKDETAVILACNVEIDLEISDTSFEVRYSDGFAGITTTNPFTINANDELTFWLTYGTT